MVSSTSSETRGTTSRLLCFFLFKGSCLPYMAIRGRFFYADECNHARANQFRMCGIYHWPLLTVVHMYVSLIALFLCVQMGLTLKFSTCFAHTLMNETPGLKRIRLCYLLIGQCRWTMTRTVIRTQPNTF